MQSPETGKAGSEPSEQRPTRDTSLTRGPHSHLLSHLLEVIKQLQGCAEAFRDEAAALAAPAHEPARGQVISLRGVPAAPRAATSQPTDHTCAIPYMALDCVPWDGDTVEFPALTSVLVQCQAQRTRTVDIYHLLQGNPSGKRPHRGWNRERTWDPVLCPNRCAPPLYGLSLLYFTVFVFF